MKSLLRLTLVITAGAALAATALAQSAPPPFQRDGQADPDFAVPDALNLSYALSFALDNNFSIRQAKERLRQQEGIVLEVRAQQLPSLSASAGYSRLDREISSTGENRSWNVGITARQVLFAGGGVRSAVKSQQLALEAATLEMQAVIDAALLDVRTRFYNVLVSRERIKVQEQNVELLQRQLQDVRNRFEAGTVSNFEVLRAEVALANAQPPLISARNNYRIAIEELRQSLGFTSSDTANVAKVPEFVGSLDFAPVSFELSSALSTAKARRPDLQRLRKLGLAAEENVKARQANYYPDLSLVGGYQNSKRAGSSSFSDGRDGFSIGLQSTWDIFDAGATRGRVVQARSQLQQTQLAFEEAELSVTVEVRRALSSLQEATELAEASKRVVEQADEAVRLADARYSAGTATQLDVLQARTDLTTARLNQLEAYYRFNVAHAAVRRAMGLPDESVAAERN
ncbi:MAG: TolC family protein [Candidatus Didemnitutus sp.]|nr:TolC family protein [Candidatus Didemnitutus sp.]